MLKNSQEFLTFFSFLEKQKGLLEKAWFFKKTDTFFKFVLGGVPRIALA